MPVNPSTLPTRSAAAPLFRGRLLPVFGFFAGMQKGTPTRAPQVVMSTRPGCFPEITSEQICLMYKAKVTKRLDAETVFLTCPTLSEEAGRKLPNPVERSLLGATILAYLEAEEENRRWAEEKVRQNPDSPALYLYTRWWAAVCDTHEALRMLRAAEWERWADAENDEAKQAMDVAVARCSAADEVQNARTDALLELS